MQRLRKFYGSIAKRYPRRQAIISPIIAAIIWLLLSAIGGVVELEAGGFWEKKLQPLLRTTVPLYWICATLPLVIILAFIIGSVLTLQDKSDQDTLIPKSSRLVQRSASSELIGDRTRVRDRDLKPIVYASKIILRLNEGRISEEHATSLLREFGYDARRLMNEDDEYALSIRKSRERGRT